MADRRIRLNIRETTYNRGCGAGGPRTHEIEDKTAHAACLRPSHHSKGTSSPATPSCSKSAVIQRGHESQFLERLWTRQDGSRPQKGGGASGPDWLLFSWAFATPVVFFSSCGSPVPFGGYRLGELLETIGVLVIAYPMFSPASPVCNGLFWSLSFRRLVLAVRFHDRLPRGTLLSCSEGLDPPVLRHDIRHAASSYTLSTSRRGTARSSRYSGRGQPWEPPSRPQGIITPYVTSQRSTISLRCHCQP